MNGFSEHQRIEKIILGLRTRWQHLALMGINPQDKVLAYYQPKEDQGMWLPATLTEDSFTGVTAVIREETEDLPQLSFKARVYEIKPYTTTH